MANGQAKVKQPPRADGEPRGLGTAVLRWHHGLAQVTGGLSLRIAKHSLVRLEVQAWVDSIRAIADEMQAFVEGNTE